MMNVACDGFEENLDLCSFDWAPEGACNHSMDAVVECYGGAPSGDVSTPEQCSINALQELLTLARRELNNERDARLREMAALDNKISGELWYNLKYNSKYSSINHTLLNKICIFGRNSSASNYNIFLWDN